MRLKFLKSVLYGLVAMALSVSAVVAEDYDYSDTDYGHVSAIPMSWDLAGAADRARRNNTPLLLMFSAQDCDYCKRLEAEILDPMVLSGDYDHKILIRRVMTDSYRKVQDFQGRTLDMDEFSSRYNIKVTPTVLIVDHQGREMAPRIVGVNTLEMYSAYLDRAIDVSWRELQR